MSIITTHTIIANTAAHSIGMIASNDANAIKNIKYGIPTTVNDSAVTNHCRRAMTTVELMIHDTIFHNLSRYVSNTLVLIGSIFLI